ncbi:hypothetical protein OUZ56_021954 [Daphnia magna]|uniref:Secreted protein n=1 Tax=Daphnia magna TaxID=35525 RepID=A0ABR0AUY1_9CRUS|nr:hypothetical protein OUZ56_021954 [Daphnia magna]
MMMMMMVPGYRIWSPGKGIFCMLMRGGPVENMENSSLLSECLEVLLFTEVPFVNISNWARPSAFGCVWIRKVTAGVIYLA